MKLTPDQIGRVAFYVETVINQFPEPESREGDEKEVGVEERFKEPWEAALEQLVNTDQSLPDYNQLPEPLLETLIDYYD